jgi:uncharacterized protein DUF6249
MNPWVFVALAPFVMVASIVWFSLRAQTERRTATLRVVEEAIKGGQTMTPDTIRALGMPRKDSNGDLKSGLILVAVAAGFVVLGWAAGVVSGEEEAMYMMPAIAAFPGFIGLVLVGFGLLGRKKEGSE